MKESDLRIGNWLNWYSEYHCNGFFDKQLEIEDFTQTDLLLAKPIPLTEEWLLKFGFEIGTGKISYDKNKLSIYLGDTILSNENGRTYWNSWAILEESPKYVHQLQNLYFALTGEELQLK